MSLAKSMNTLPTEGGDVATIGPSGGQKVTLGIFKGVTCVVEQINTETLTLLREDYIELNDVSMEHQIWWCKSVRSNWMTLCETEHFPPNKPYCAKRYIDRIDKDLAHYGMFTWLMT